MTERFCTCCKAVVSFERPPCPDGHGGDCAEWACVLCGEAIFVAPNAADGGLQRSAARPRRVA